MAQETSTPTDLDPMREFAETLARLDALARNPQLQVALGQGLLRELRYPISSYRQRFPELWPSAQASLF
ncbi:hypothetical protein ACFONC_03320 [Luteimonas soli]|uniref:Uncharacterized protein n=1 Tax=Luteimonas soli TaxID=1648966 RepID=A0ABV7XGA3_9GAMM